MLHLIPAPLHRAALRGAHALRRRWWRLRKPRLSGVRVIAFDGEGRVILVRHSYGSGKWMLPGGGLKRGEAPLAAGIRELREETGCGLDSAVLVDVHDEPMGGTVNRVHLVCGHAAGVLSPDGREIVAARAFAADALPGDLATLFARRLPGWLKAAEAVLRAD